MTQRVVLRQHAVHQILLKLGSVIFDLFFPSVLWANVLIPERVFLFIAEGIDLHINSD